MYLPESQKVWLGFIYVHKYVHLAFNVAPVGWNSQQAGNLLCIFREAFLHKMTRNRGQKVKFLCSVAEILPQIPQLFRQLPHFVIRSGVNFILRSKCSIPQEVGGHSGGAHPGYECAARAKCRPSRRDAEALAVKPQRIFLPANGNALAALPKLLFHKRGSIGAGGTLLEKCYNTLNAVLLVAAAGEGAANDRRLHLTGRSRRMLLGCPPVLLLGFGNTFNLFLHRGEQGEQREVRQPRGRRFLHRRRNGGLFAHRLLLFLIYL